MNYYDRKRERQIQTLKKYGLLGDFLKSDYKYLTSYLKNAYREKKIKTLKEVYGL